MSKAPTTMTRSTTKAATSSARKQTKAAPEVQAAKRVEAQRNSVHSSATNTPRKVEPQTFRIPKDVVEKAKDLTHKSFDTTRAWLNRTLAKHPEFQKSQHGTKRNIAEMAKGRNPYTPRGTNAGKRAKMEYDHLRERREIEKTFKKHPDKIRAGVTNAGNISLKTPTAHQKKISYKFNTASGAPVENSPAFRKSQTVKRDVTRPTTEATKGIGKAVIRKK